MTLDGDLLLYPPSLTIARLREQDIIDDFTRKVVDGRAKRLLDIAVLALEFRHGMAHTLSIHLIALPNGIAVAEQDHLPMHGQGHFNLFAGGRG